MRHPMHPKVCLKVKTSKQEKIFAKWQHNIILSVHALTKYVTSNIAGTFSGMVSVLQISERPFIYNKTLNQFHPLSCDLCFILMLITGHHEINPKRVCFF